MTAHRLVAATFGVICLVGCGRSKPDLRGKVIGPVTGGAELGTNRIPDPAYRLADVGAEWNLDFQHRCGVRRPLTIVETMGSGCAILDYDGDGWQDVLMVSAGPDFKVAGERSGTRLYRNERGRLVDVTRKSGVDLPGYLMGCAAGDYDNDGRTDLFLTGFGRDYLLRNAGNGVFTDQTERAGIRRRKDSWGTGCSFVDVNRDGLLDVYVANYVVYDPEIPLCRSGSTMTGCTPNQYRTQPNELYINLGGGLFKAAAREMGADDPAGAGLGVLVRDFDDDGWPDIFVANDGTPNALLQNRNGRFRNRGEAAGVAFAETGGMRAGMGCESADVDGDGKFDLVITNFQHEPNSLYVNTGGLAFREESYPSGIGTPSVLRLGFGVSFVDLNGDGRQDLFVGNGHVYDNVAEFDASTTFEQLDQVLINRGSGKFVEAPAGATAPATPSVTRGLAIGDLDNDGSPEVLTNNLGRPARLLSAKPDAPVHWLGLTLRGTRSNRSAIGARVTVRSEGGIQTREVSSGGSYLSQHDFRALFRFGPVVPKGLRIEIRWPSGRRQKLGQLALNRYHSVVEPEEGQ